MLPAAPLTLTLALAPPTSVQPPTLATELDHAELTGTEDELQITGYDSHGEIIAMIALWTDSRGRIHLASDYGDGYAETIIDGDERYASESTLPAELVERRARLMVERIVVAPGAGPQRGYLMCAASVAVAVGLCTVTHAGIIVTCPAGVITAVCTCAPVLDLEASICEL